MSVVFLSPCHLPEILFFKKIGVGRMYSARKHSTDRAAVQGILSKALHSLQDSEQPQCLLKLLEALTKANSILKLAPQARARVKAFSGAEAFSEENVHEMLEQTVKRMEEESSEVVYAGGNVSDLHVAIPPAQLTTI